MTICTMIYPDQKARPWRRRPMTSKSIGLKEVLFMSHNDHESLWCVAVIMWLLHAAWSDSISTCMIGSLHGTGFEEMRTMRIAMVEEEYITLTKLKTNLASFISWGTSKGRFDVETKRRWSGLDANLTHGRSAKARKMIYLLAVFLCQSAKIKSWKEKEFRGGKQQSRGILFYSFQGGGAGVWGRGHLCGMKTVDGEAVYLLFFCNPRPALRLYRHVLNVLDQ